MTPEQERLTQAVAGTKAQLKAMIAANGERMAVAATVGEIQQLSLLNIAIRSIGTLRFGADWFSR